VESFRDFEFKVIDERPIVDELLDEGIAIRNDEVNGGIVEPFTKAMRRVQRLDPSWTTPSS